MCKKIGQPIISTCTETTFSLLICSVLIGTTLYKIKLATQRWTVWQNVNSQRTRRDETGQSEAWFISRALDETSQRCDSLSTGMSAAELIFTDPAINRYSHLSITPFNGAIYIFRFCPFLDFSICPSIHWVSKREWLFLCIFIRNISFLWKVAFKSNALQYCVTPWKVTTCIAFYGK